MENMLMTPGPTYVNEQVRNAMTKPMINPDLEKDFFEYYYETCQMIKELLNTKNDALILAGEAILGLEAACASLIEPGDKVLCIDNGIFGKGFADFVKTYGGEVVLYKDDYEREIDVNKLKKFLKDNNDFKIATMVHCETPSGITNEISDICMALKQYNIITVVDAVSSIGGEKVKVDNWGIDIVLGGSQKCLSAPPGLTFLTISEKAWDKILNRKVPIASFYCNLANWKTWYEDKWFPYTQAVSDIYAFNKALELILKDKNIINRHKKIGSVVRQVCIDAGLELYPLSGYSNTVTTIKVPEGITYQQLYDEMLITHHIVIAGAFDFLKDKVFRIGHMGENCYEDKMYLFFEALDKVLRNKGIKLNVNLYENFSEIINEIK